MYVFCIYIVGHLVCLFYKYLWHVGVLFSVLLCHNICVTSFNFFSNMGVPLCVLHLHGGPFGGPFLYKYLWQYGVLFSVLLRQIFCVASFPFVFKYGSSFAFPIHKIWFDTKNWQMWAIWCAFFINSFDMLVCFLVCFYVTIFAWLLLTL